MIDKIKIYKKQLKEADIRLTAINLSLEQKVKERTAELEKLKAGLEQSVVEKNKELYQKLNEGYEVVYAQRRSRKGETVIKRLISHIGYKMINALADVSIPRNTGDFRIMTRRVIEELRKLNESHGFLRGLVAYVGFKQTAVEYDRDSRFSGRGHYNRFTGSLKIGLNGLIGFSSRPLQLMSVLGASTALLSFIIGFWYVIQKLFGFKLSPGLSTTILAITFFSGVQLLCLGLVGEYIGRIYDEAKKRPIFIIDRMIGFQTTEKKES